MTTLAIVANHEKKRLSLTGTVAAGEHVAVTLEDGWAWANAAGAALRLRVVFAGKLIAEFPRRDADPADTWSASGDDATCELNINSVPAAKHLKFGGDCVWVLDDPQLNTLYGVGELEVLPWRREPGGDVPYNLDGYPDLLNEFEEVKDAVGEFNAKKIDKSAFISLLGKSLPETATQSEIRQMVYDILESLKNAAVCVVLAFALPAFGIDADIAWEDMPPQIKVRSVVKQFSSAPGNYAAVSNTAMNALSRAEAKAGFTEWDFTHAPDLITANPELKWVAEQGEWAIYLNGDIQTYLPGSIDDIRVNFGGGSYATRTRLPTMADIINATNGIPRITESESMPGAAAFAEESGNALSLGDRAAPAIIEQLDAATAALDGKASTNDVQLTPVYGGNGQRFGEWSIIPERYFPSYYPEGYTVDFEYRESDGAWYLIADGLRIGDGVTGSPDATAVSIEFDGVTYSGTRNVNSVIGYTLGAQTNKVLVATNGLVTAQIVTKIVADATNGIPEVASNAAVAATAPLFRPFGDEYVYESKGMGDFTYESENTDIVAALGNRQPDSWEDGDYAEYYFDVEVDGRYWWGNAYAPKNSPVVTFMFYSDYWDDETGEYYYDEVEVIGRRQPGGWDRTDPIDTFAHQSELTSINASITSLRSTLNGETKDLRTGKYGEYGTGYGYVQRMLDNERRIWRIRVPKFASVSGMTTNNTTMTPSYRTVDDATTPSTSQDYIPKVLSNIQTWLPGWNFSRKLRETRGIYGTDSVSFADYDIGLFYGGGTDADMCVLNYVVAHTNRSPMCFNVAGVTNGMAKILVDATQGKRNAFVRYVDYPQVHVRLQTSNTSSYTVTNENWLTMKALGFYDGITSTSNGTIPLGLVCIFDAELRSEQRTKSNGQVTVRTASVTNVLTTATVTINCTSATTLENVYAPYYRLVTTHDDENNFYYDSVRDCTYRIAVTNGCFYSDWVMDGDWRKKGL